MTQLKHNGYILVKTLDVSGTGLHHCDGCVARGSEASASALCRELSAVAPDDEHHYCAGVIWIHDTDEGKAAYLAARMGV